MNNANESILFRDPTEAFSNAINWGFLSVNPKAKNYAGDWMYMHTEASGADVFKHVVTRKYSLVRNLNPLPLTISSQE